MSSPHWWGSISTSFLVPRLGSGILLHSTSYLHIVVRGDDEQYKMFIFNRKKRRTTRNINPYQESWWGSSRTLEKKDQTILDQLLKTESQKKNSKGDDSEFSDPSHKPTKDKPQETLNRQFPCEQCGAVQAYQPGTEHLVCEYCGHDSIIEESDIRIREYDFRTALKQLQKDHPNYEQPITKCENCAAEFAFDEHIHADECPFCGTHIVSATGGYKHFRPQSLLPFAIKQEQAQTFFHQWVDGLWFAPSSIKHAVKDKDKLVGVYLPYWTYDSDTDTSYTGQRGDHYQERQVYWVNHNGRRTQETRYVTKTRWRTASGYVSRYFNDLLIGATHSLPRNITDNLQPWDLHELVPYKSEYLSGFRSEVYQVALDEGFDVARTVMDNIIRTDICRDIGGDVQRIHSQRTQHSDTTYKHLLLPVWSAAFRSGGKTYRFVVNGRSGKVRGERPYSAWKIFGAILLVAMVVGGLILAGGGLEQY